MTRKNVLGLLLTASALSVAMLAGAKASNALLAKPTAVAVVDLEQVFNNSKIKNVIEAEQASRRDAMNAEREKLNNRIQGLQLDLQTLTPGTADHRQKQDELEKAAIEKQAWEAYMQRKLGREQGLQIERLYKDATTAVGEVAEQNGYDVVLLRNDVNELKYENLQQLVATIGGRKVVWNRKELDITEQVIQRMNIQYDHVR